MRNLITSCATCRLALCVRYARRDVAQSVRWRARRPLSRAAPPSRRPRRRSRRPPAPKPRRFRAETAAARRPAVRALDHRSAHRGDRRPQGDPRAHVVACDRDDVDAGAAASAARSTSTARSPTSRSSKINLGGIGDIIEGFDGTHGWALSADDRARCSSRARSSSRRSSTPTSTAICTTRTLRLDEDGRKDRRSKDVPATRSASSARTAARTSSSTTSRPASRPEHRHARDSDGADHGDADASPTTRSSAACSCRRR